MKKEATPSAPVRSRIKDLNQLHDLACNGVVVLSKFGDEIPHDIVLNWSLQEAMRQLVVCELYAY